MSCIHVQRSLELMRMAEGPCERAAQIAADLFDKPLRQLIGPRRHRHLVQARWFAMWAAHQSGQVSYAQIGRYFGNRDHSTVCYAIRGIEDLMSWRMGLKATGDQMLRRMGLA